MELSNYWAADFETTPYSQYLIDEKTRVWLYYVENLSSTESKIGLDINEFLDFIFCKSENQICYFHYLSFDGEFITWALIWKGFEYKDYFGTEPRDNYTFTYFKDNRNNIYTIKVFKNDLVYEFRCSYRLIPMGVDAIAESTKQKTKGRFKYDYTKCHYETQLNHVAQNEIDYIINDVRVVKEVLIQFNKMVGLGKITLASTAYYNWAYVNYPDWAEEMGGMWWLEKKSDFWDNKEQHNWYTGGFCYLNPKYKNKQLDFPIYVKDVNSLFPHTMRNMWLVSPLKDDCKEPKCKHPALLKLQIEWGKIKEGYHPFIYEKGFSRKDPISEFKNKVFYWTNIDLKLFITFYNYKNIKLLDKHCFRWAKGWFDNYIDYWYKMKVTSPKNSWEWMFAKLMLNALYGKFGSKANRPKKVMTTENPPTDLYKKYENYYEYTEVLEDEDYLAKYDRVKDNGDIVNTLKVKFKPIAIFITARAREYLVTYIQKNREHFIYCDTDSIHSTKPIEVDGRDDPNKIGDWKSEGANHDDGIYYDGGKYLNKKQYVLKEGDELKVKVCGLSNKCKGLVTMENFNYQYVYEQAKPLPMKVKGGIVIKNVDFRIRE